MYCLAHCTPKRGKEEEGKKKDKWHVSPVLFALAPWPCLRKGLTPSSANACKTGDQTRDSRWANKPLIPTPYGTTHPMVWARTPGRWAA